ncbi:MAG TPA: hypothetical protein VGK74_01690 [Symbiobacteriaceae bacterium]|jgi:hypothetical protein
MTRPIEAVVAEAQQRLESSGRLDVAAFISAYPEHAEELAELLPVMLTVHRESQWRAAEGNSRAFALALFAQLHEADAPAEVTLGDLFNQAGLSLEEQARRSGLPVRALEQLAQSHTPVSALNDNTVLKQLATQAAAPFGALAKEVRRMLSLQSLTSMRSGPVFTRNQETSTEDERQALLEQVRKASQKPPEGKP